MNFNFQHTEERLDDLSLHKGRSGRRAAVTVLKVFVLFLVLAAATGGSIAFGALRGVISNAPDISSIDVSPSGYASKIYDSQGNVMETLVRAGSNREEVHYDQIPKNLVNAFVAIEDSRFFTHNGIDVKGIFRAAGVALTSGNFSEGASTITQQLIKNNVFEGGMEKNLGDRFERKFQEQYLALKLEENLSKELIMEYYLNTINLGSNSLGVQSASRRYFGKNVSELTLSECAVIAATTNNPSRYNPITHPDKNAERRDKVLRKMLEQGLITQPEYDEALTDDVYSRIQNNNSTVQGSARIYSYFTDSVVESVLQDLQEKAGYSQTQAYNLLYSGGLTIQSTMDPEVQTVVDEEIANLSNFPETYYTIVYRLTVEHADGTTTRYTESDLKKYFIKELGNATYRFLFNSDEEIEAALEQFRTAKLTAQDKIISESYTKTIEPQMSMVVMDQTNGHVVAINGGRGEKQGNLVLNRATDSTRQPGSCFKVLVDFAPAIDKAGATLATTYYDSPFSANNQQFANWWSSNYVGYANIRQGIAYSMNIIAMKCLMDTVTVDVGFEYAKNFGISTLVDSQLSGSGTYSDKVPSIGLGGLTYGVTNLELTAAYASIANMGEYQEPVFYTKILDHDGKVILDNTPKTHTVLKETSAFLLTKAMEETMKSDCPFEVVDSNIHETGQECYFEGMSLAGKSGSSTHNYDNWFVGYSPYYTCGVWYGYDDTYMFDGGQSCHKYIWKNVMQRINSGKTDIGFPGSNEIETAKICSKSGLLAIDGVCDKAEDTGVVYTEYFAKGTAPTEYCNRHTKVSVCTVSGMMAGENCPPDLCEDHIFLSIDKADYKEGEFTDDCKYLMPDGFLDRPCTLAHRLIDNNTHEEVTGEAPTDEYGNPVNPSDETGREQDPTSGVLTQYD